MVPLETQDAGSVSISAHDGPAFEVEYHPDGARIATSGRDGKAVIWDAVTLEPLQRLQPHQSVIVWDVPWDPHQEPGRDGRSRRISEPLGSGNGLVATPRTDRDPAASERHQHEAGNWETS